MHSVRTIRCVFLVVQCVMHMTCNVNHAEVQVRSHNATNVIASPFGLC